MKLASYVACICEGGAETVIMNLLLDHDLLIMQRKDLLEEQVLSCRSGREFETRYLRKGFSDKVSVIRILDSRRENFKLSKAYQPKVDVINVITAPEIEMLIILSEGRYDDFKKAGKKPSDFCREDLKMQSVKSPAFVGTYFAEIEKLVAAIHDYTRVTSKRPGEYRLSDLLDEKKTCGRPE